MKTYPNDMGYNTQHGVRIDGGAGSGNWGHVGRPGEIGGSATGGGLAFRGESTLKWMKKDIGKYTSQAKIRNHLLNQQKKGTPRAQAIAAKRASHYNMEQKSYRNVTKYDPNASKNILKNAKQGKISTTSGIQGTKALRDYATKTQSSQQTSQQTKTQSSQQPKTQAQNQAQTSNQNQTKTQATTSNTNNQQSNTNSQSNNQATQPGQRATKTNQQSTPTQTGRPTGNPNYQKAIAASGDKAAEKAFYKEAKANGTFNTDPRGGKYSDSTSDDNGNIQKLVNYMGLTEKPTLVDKATFKQLSKGREDQVIFRGASSSVGEDQFKHGDCNRMGGIAFGTGVYFGGSKDGTFKTSCGYGQDIKALPKPDAKILEVNSSGVDKNGKQWRNQDSNYNTQYTSAIIAGYDAVKIKNVAPTSSNKSQDYIVVWNRAAFVVEE